MIDRNHPAVEAANMGVQEWLAGPGPFDDDPVRLASDMTAVCINAAREHYTADDLRHTPAGKQLMAEAAANALKGDREERERVEREEYEREMQMHLRECGGCRFCVP